MFMVVRLYFSFFDQILMDISVSNSGGPDQMPHFEASHQGHHCFHMSHIIDARLIRFNNSNSMFLSCFVLANDWFVGKIKWFLHFNKNSCI